MSILDELSPYIYGTTRLGDSNIAFEDRVALARQAIDASVWIHTSHTYGDALHVLKQAFDLNREKLPKTIFKIGWDSVGQVRDVIHDNITPLGIRSMDIGQLCLSGPLAESLKTGDGNYRSLLNLKKEGLVRGFVLEVFPWTSPIPEAALKSGRLMELVDGLIFYLNPMQRFMSNPLWDIAVEQGIPMVAMRTVGGGDVRRMAQGDAYAPYMHERAKQIAPIFERSGVDTWLEFASRFAFSFPNVKATVGATGRVAGLHDFLATTNRKLLPLSQSIVDEITSLQRVWSDDVDMNAEPWTM